MEVYRTALALITAGKPAALGIVLHTRGSTPQKAGAKALFERAGRVHGTLGGGCLEAEARQRALLTLDTWQPAHFTVNLDEVDGWDDGLICGGRATIFTSPLLPTNGAAFTAAAAAQANDAAGTLVTVLTHPAYPTGTAMWLPEGAMPPAGIGTADLSHASGRETPLLVSDTEDLAKSSVAWFLEPVSAPPRLVIAGAGHIGKALSHFAARVGFRVVILDDRPTFATTANIPDAHDVHCGDLDKLLREMPLTSRDYVVIVTRGHRHDATALAACVNRELAYLGLIGSKRKGLLLRKRLLDQKLATEEEIARVVSPIGFDIGGATVEEIALSITAQLVSVRRRGKLEAPSLAYSRPNRGGERPVV